MRHRTVTVLGVMTLAVFAVVALAVIPGYRTQTLADTGFVRWTQCVKLRDGTLLPSDNCADAQNRSWLVWGTSPKLALRHGPVHISLYGRRPSDGGWGVYLHDNGLGSGVEWSWIGFAARTSQGRDDVPLIFASEDVSLDALALAHVEPGPAGGSARCALIAYYHALPEAALIRGHSEVELEINIDSSWGDADPDPKIVYAGESGPYLYAALDGASVVGLDGYAGFDGEWVWWSLQVNRLLRWVSKQRPEAIPEPSTGWASWVVEGIGASVETHWGGFAGLNLHDLRIGSHDVPVYAPMWKGSNATPTPAPGATPTPNPCGDPWGSPGCE